MRFFVLVLCLCGSIVAGRVDAATLTVNSGGDLQAAINAAQPGDTILLQAGAVFTGTFTLPAKGGSSYITIRSAASDGALPAAGVRITPAYAGALPKIRSQAGAAFRTVGAASYWRLMFLEILPASSTGTANLIELGTMGAAQSSLASVPHHLIVDRCYIHGDPAYAQRRGIALNSGETQILNSYISEIKSQSYDAQAIGGWNGPGPYLIENNYVEASTENIMFGGADPSIANLVPSNITIRRNLISKPLAWLSSPWIVKNLIELKNADTVLIEGNTIENNWVSGQAGYALVLTPRNQDNTAPWSVVQNVTVQHNVIRHVAGAVSILGYDTNAQSRQTNNIAVRNNLVYDVRGSYAIPGAGGDGRFVVMGNGPRDLTFDHNTIDNEGNNTFMLFEALTAPATTQMYGVVITNNLMRDNAYGIFGNNSQEGAVSLSIYAPGATVLRNAIAGADARYPGGNDFPTMTQWIGDFVGRSTGNYQLLSTSLSKGTATDGTDIGVNFSTLNAALNGTTAEPPPPPPPPPPPVTSGTPAPFTGTPIAVPGRIEAENYDVGGDTVSFHDTTPGNEAGEYRGDDVDIRATTDSSGAYNVKTVRAGEWLGYTVNIASAGTYNVSFRLASSGTGGAVHLTIDGTNVSGTINLPDTGGWSVWQTFTKSGVTLPAGRHFFKIKMDANGSGGTMADLNWIDIGSASAPPPPPPPPVVSPAFSGTPVALPGRIEAENYDKGGEGVAYHDTTSGNSDQTYRNDDVDIRVTTDAAGSYNIKGVRAGEWLAYTVNVVSGGTYAIDLRVASSGGGGTVHVTVDGVNVSGMWALPDTGGWNAWTTVTRTGVSLSAGVHVLKIKMDANGPGGTVADINWLAIR